MKRILPAALVLLLLAGVGAAGLWQHYRVFLQTPLNLPEPGLVVEVPPGTGIRALVADLESKGVTTGDWRWRLLGRLHEPAIKTGEYRLTTGLLPQQLLDLLASGKVVSYRFTIIEGWTVKQLLEALHLDPVLEHEVTAVDDLQTLPGLPAGNPEGWFLPETYAFVRGDSDLDILRRAYEDMREALARTWAGRAAGLPYETEYELLTLASIVEKETSLPSERADIAGVFVRRLQKRWRLETDPTVIYGMGDSYDGDIRRADIERDTPYNTYTRHGLPPTPIALPGLASLQATANPAAGDSMFFVANGQGGHTFSSTLEAHNKAVRQLLQNNRKQPVKPGEKG